MSLTSSHSPIKDQNLSKQGDQDCNFHHVASILKAKQWLIFNVMGIAAILACIYLLNFPEQYETEALIQVNNGSDMLKQLISDTGNSAVSVERIGPVVALNSQLETALIDSRFILQPIIKKFNLDVIIKPHYFPIFGAYFAHHYYGTGLANPVLGLTSYPWGGEKLTLQQFIVNNNYMNKHFYLVVGEHAQYKLYYSGKLILQGGIGQEVVSTVMPGVKILVSELVARPGVKFSLTPLNMGMAIKHFTKSFTLADLGQQSSSGGYFKVYTGILRLQLRGTEADKITQVLNGILFYDIEKNVERKVTEVQKVLTLLTQEVQLYRDELQQAETALSNYKSKHHVVAIELSGQNMIGQMVSLDKSIEELKLKKLVLLQEYTEQHPFVREVSLEQQKLQQQLIALEARVSTFPQAEQDIVTLKRNVETKGQLYLLILKRIQQLQIIKDGSIADVKVLTAATTAEEEPIYPLLIVLGSMVLGFLFAVAIILFRYPNAGSKESGVENSSNDLALTPDIKTTVDP